MIADYLGRLEAALRRLPADERQAVLDEVSAHLREQTAELQGQGMSAADAEAAAIGRFGTPEEIAAGYDEAEGVVRRPTGEVVLEVTKAVGRGAGKAAIGVGKVAGKGIGGLFRFIGAVVITALIVSGAIVVAAIVFADDWAPFVQDTIEEHVEHELYRADLGSLRNETFYAPEASAMSLSWLAWDGDGCVDVRLYAPNGTMAYKGSICDDGSGKTTLAPVTGTWHVTVEGSRGGDGWLSVSYRPPNDPSQ